VLPPLDQRPAAWTHSGQLEPVQRTDGGAQALLSHSEVTLGGYYGAMTHDESRRTGSLALAPLSDVAHVKTAIRNTASSTRYI